MRIVPLSKVQRTADALWDKYKAEVGAPYRRRLRPAVVLNRDLWPGGARAALWSREIELSPYQHAYESALVHEVAHLAAPPDSYTRRVWRLTGGIYRQRLETVDVYHGPTFARWLGWMIEARWSYLSAAGARRRYMDNGHLEYKYVSNKLGLVNLPWSEERRLDALVEIVEV